MISSIGQWFFFYVSDNNRHILIDLFQVRLLTWEACLGLPDLNFSSVCCHFSF